MIEHEEKKHLCLADLKKVFIYFNIFKLKALECFECLEISITYLKHKYCHKTMLFPKILFL